MNELFMPKAWLYILIEMMETHSIHNYVLIWSTILVQQMFCSPLMKVCKYLIVNNFPHITTTTKIRLLVHYVLQQIWCLNNQIFNPTKFSRICLKTTQFWEICLQLSTTTRKATNICHRHSQTKMMTLYVATQTSRMSYMQFCDKNCNDQDLLSWSLWM